jgi:hypothetical protein
MTEAQWLSSPDPAAMLRHLTHRRIGMDAGGAVLETGRRPALVSDRKLRLFACACVRQAWHLLDDPRSRRAVEVAERYADGGATKEELLAAWKAAREYAHTTDPNRDDEAYAAVQDAWACANITPGRAAEVIMQSPHAIPPPAQAALLRCVVGNPFRAVTLPRPWVETPCPDCPPGAPDENCDDCGGSGTERKLGTCPWLTPTVLALAWRAYDERDFGLLPVLADALEDAGCADAELLAHLRGPGPHARGCHALDLVLGKE